VPNGSSETIKNPASFIWSVADLLRGDDKQSEYGKVVLPLTVLRRFDCVLAPVKQDMLDTHQRVKDRVDNFAPLLDALTSVGVQAADVESVTFAIASAGSPSVERP
jgi:type I restriction-modification system DNA methylase subunit